MSTKKQLTKEERKETNKLTEKEIDKKLKQIKKYMERKNENKDLEALKREMDMNNSKLVVHPGSDMIPVSDIMSRSPPSSLSSSPSSSLSSEPIHIDEINLETSPKNTSTSKAAPSAAVSGMGNTPANLSSTNFGENCCKCIGETCECATKCIGGICQCLLGSSGGKKNRKSKTKKFKKHYMWNTKGKRYMAKTHKQHMRGVKLGHTHKKPKKSKRRTKKRGGNPNRNFMDMSSLGAVLPGVTWGQPEYTNSSGINHGHWPKSGLYEEDGKTLKYNPSQEIQAAHYYNSTFPGRRNNEKWGQPTETPANSPMPSGVFISRRGGRRKTKKRRNKM
tara:strand:- start:1721 stop:2722 length:1002 start_codon:yes stop_codon:yes gene_type:complete